MSLFTNDKDLTEQLEATKAEVNELENLVQQREAEIKDLSEKMADLSERTEVITTESAETLAAHAEMAEQLETSKLALAESEAKQEDFDAKVNAAALAKMQEIGVSEPVETVKDEDDSQLSRAAFNKLSPAEKSSFAISGGRIK